MRKGILSAVGLGLSVLMSASSLLASPAEPHDVKNARNVSGVVDPTDLPGAESSQQPKQPSVSPEPEASSSTTEGTPPSETSTPPEQSEQIAPPESAEESVPTVAPFSDSMLAEARGSVEGCTYATEGSGTYAQTLCWIDFSTVGIHNGEEIALSDSTRYRNRGLGNRPRYVSLWEPDGQGWGVHTTGNNDGSLGSVEYGDVHNLDVRAELPGGYLLTAKLSISAQGSGLFNTIRDKSRHIRAKDFPTYEGAFLGNGFYEMPTPDVLPQPAIYQRTNGGLGDAVTEVKLSNIKLRDRDGQEISDYSIVVADAESTDEDESITWETEGRGFQWLPNNQYDGNDSVRTMGNACGAGFYPAIGEESTKAECHGSDTAGGKTGTAMLHTQPEPGQQFDVTQVLTGTGLQGVAFGLITAQAQINVQAPDRVLGANGESRIDESFTGKLDFGDNRAPVEVNTGGDPDVSSGEYPVPVGADGHFLEFSSGESGEHSSSYTSEWVCTKTDISGSGKNRWPNTGTSSGPPLREVEEDREFATIRPGEFIDCTVTYAPPYLTLEKEVDNVQSDAANTNEDFTLQASGVEAPNSTFAGVPGTEQTTKRPIAVGDYSLTEQMPDPNAEGNWQYGYSLTDLRCTYDDGSELPTQALSLERDEVSDEIIDATLSVAAAQYISCTYTNTALEPHLEVSKISDIDQGDAVEAGQEITYILTLDNAEGTAPISADHVDHLHDVLDDTSFNESSIVNGGLEVETDISGENPRLLITGTVGPGETKTVTYTVTVSSHEDNLAERQGTEEGYTLNNFLTERLDFNGDPIDAPEACDLPDEGELPTCTSNPIPAWTVDKGSFPADGARLNRGGNTHYVLTARKLNNETSIQNLQFHDDLTHVFKTAGWDPEAAVPGGARVRGVYFNDAQGNTLDANGDPNGTAESPTAAYGAEEVFEELTKDNSDRWILRTEPVDVPAEAVNAELWFAVESGQQTNSNGIPGTNAWEGDDAPANGWQYVNYGFADADTSPVQCSIPEESAQPVIGDGGEVPQNETVPEACRTQHELNAGHFTIRKDAVGTGIDVPNGPTEIDTFGNSSRGLWNLIGHEFEIQDDVNGEPSGYPSQYFCRTDYNPENGWNGEFSDYQDAIAGGDEDDWEYSSGDESATLVAIRDWNRENPDDQLPECAVFDAQPEGSGGQTGRYRGENLQPLLAPGEAEANAQERDFWLIETKAPTEQLAIDGSTTRAIPGVQLLAEPIPFTVWPSYDGIVKPGEENGPPSYHGKRQLDLRDGEGAHIDRCSPGAAATARPIACVNSTGYLMLVQDTVPMRLPLTGGQWLTLLVGLGVTLLAVALGGTYLKRRRSQQ